MRRVLYLPTLTFVGCVLLAVSEVSAQGYRDYDDGYDSRPGRQKTIRCESDGGRYEYCPTSTRGSIRIERQLSRTPCRLYDTWGADGDGSSIWVRDGCRAVFVVEEYRRPQFGGGGGGGRGQTVTCKSEHYQYNFCRANIGRRRDVRVQRQLSDTPCYEGDNWGVERGGIWVERGCAAVFVIE
jgi:hypothetical protein